MSTRCQSFGVCSTHLRLIRVRSSTMETSTVRTASLPNIHTMITDQVYIPRNIHTTIHRSVHDSLAHSPRPIYLSLPLLRSALMLVHTYIALSGSSGVRHPYPYVLLSIHFTASTRNRSLLIDPYPPKVTPHRTTPPHHTTDKNAADSWRPYDPLNRLRPTGSR
ncbi:hypothetical protein P175DRAFT_077310 [Aspergillus ochraceoroseus IBT 24754]|uniref:Uncharacterized protein n=1 Tax=Aspergillus ochraceoroseus IBT 24754 TaxID=1392256 RepID=A0A2T5MA26_9EURO|nr:uncharacterized protein P175DRAFT_077310 [Aspergillus ochraceoroseus IBT 24754]PTU25381.1 hypothetical protein P175DRAFT_077310 [Aspergillus ochraceoroseus IBT 24754]